MATPGAITRCGATSMNSRPPQSIVPHSGAGGWTPRPRKPSAEPTSTAWPASRLISMITVVVALGRMWRSRMRA